VELPVEEFYRRLAEAPELPTTSQPSPGDFYEVFRPLAEAGHEILVVTISNELSGTWNSAMQAKDMLPDAEITVVDSLSTSVGLQLMLEAASEAIAQGATMQQVVDLLEEIKGKLSVLFVVDTLEYLAKGGRIGNAKAMLGTLLKVKPLLTLRDGRIEPLEQVRSKRKAVTRMLDLASEHLGDQAPQAKVALTHALVPEEGNEYARQVVARLGCCEPSLTDLGPVIGTHTGPGVIAMAAYA
jgi:DegV family protein with EDD domain